MMNCSRCDGTGFWAPYRTCYQCDGTGQMLTPTELQAANAAFERKEAARLKADAIAAVVAAHTKLTNAPTSSWRRRVAERALDAAETHALKVLGSNIVRR